MTLFRIITETISDDRRLRSMALRWFPDGHTIYHAIGAWHGGSEPSTILEICSDDKDMADMVRQFARTLADVNHQECVLVQSLDCIAEFVSPNPVESTIG